MADIHSTHSELNTAFGDHLKVYGQGKRKTSRQLLLFYAVECGLKARYLNREGLPSTSGFAGRLGNKFGHGHNISRWVQELAIPASSLVTFVESSLDTDKIAKLHEKLRYGVALSPYCAVDQIAYLDSIATYLKNNP